MPFLPPNQQRQSTEGKSTPRDWSTDSKTPVTAGWCTAASADHMHSNAAVRTGVRELELGSVRVL